MPCQLYRHRVYNTYSRIYQGYIYLALDFFFVSSRLWLEGYLLVRRLFSFTVHHLSLRLSWRRGIFSLFVFFCGFCFFLPIIHYRRPSDKRLDWQLINKNAGARLSRLTFRVTCQLVLFSDQSSFWLFSFPRLFFLIVVSLSLPLLLPSSSLLSFRVNWWTGDEWLQSWPVNWFSAISGLDLFLPFQSESGDVRLLCQRLHVFDFPSLKNCLRRRNIPDHQLEIWGCCCCCCFTRL